MLSINFTHASHWMAVHKKQINQHFTMKAVAFTLAPYFWKLLFWRSWLRQDNIKTNLKKQIVGVWIALIWLTIWSTGGILWIRWWTIGFSNRWLHFWLVDGGIILACFLWLRAHWPDQFESNRTGSNSVWLGLQDAKANPRIHGTWLVQCDWCRAFVNSGCNEWVCLYGQAPFYSTGPCLVNMPRVWEVR